MNRIVENFLNTHITEYSLEDWKQEKAFEHFINRIIVNKYLLERFDPSDIMTEDGEKGIDGIAIIVNNRLIISVDEILDITEKDINMDVKFIFIQSKTSNNFKGDEIGTFIYGVKAFFEEKDSRPVTNKKMEQLICIKDLIYKKSINFIEPPQLELYYVCCGKWNNDNGLQNRIDIDIKPLKESQNFKNIEFYKYDSDKIIIAFKELKKKVSRTISMEKRIAFPSTVGVKQSFLGVLQCKQFLKMLSDDDGKMLTNIFEDNVRDFQGYNAVNKEIQNTLQDTEEQKGFALLNNGITLVAKKIEITGDDIKVYDYQIVNGCQTSYVIFDNKEYITEDVYLIVKIIETVETELSDRVIYTNNRQTEVKSEAFASTKKFHKGLQDYYNTFVKEFGLYYERRSKQYDLNDTVKKFNVISLANQIASYISVFLNEPQSTHRYYGELLDAYKNRIFIENDAFEPYYVAAYLNWFLEKSFRNEKFDKEFKILKFHLMLGIKVLITDSTILSGKSRQQKKICKDIFEIMRDEHKINEYLDIALTCLKQCIDKSLISEFERHRSREFTSEYIKVINTHKGAVHSQEYLEKGNIVHCTVNYIKKYYVHVHIKTDDARNRGQIHISKLTNNKIDKCEDEVKIGDIFQVKIISDDFYESKYGWELSKII